MREEGGLPITNLLGLIVLLFERIASGLDEALDGEATKLGVAAVHRHHV